jgi:MFS family permease
MLARFLSYINSIYEKIKLFWESKINLYFISVFLVLTFIFSTLLSVLVINDYLHLGVFNENFKNPFFSIEIVFTLLLIIELFGLIFVLARSVANSVGKQFELLSLIFLRDGFKEFSHFSTNLEWSLIKDSFTNMMIYGFGAVIIFAVIGLNKSLQKHIKLTTTEEEQVQFIRLKKMLALMLLVAFLIVGFLDLKVLIETGSYLHSFHTFYTVLIFSDILIVLIALRFTFNYHKIFRYSAFVLATILIRVSLSVEPVYDVIIGVTASLFILALTITYNYFLRDVPENKLK